jgi:hypothetical protein
VISTGSIIPACLQATGFEICGLFGKDRGDICRDNGERTTINLKAVN